MEKSYYKSQIGNLEIICENDALISLKLSDKFGKAEYIFTPQLIENGSNDF